MHRTLLRPYGALLIATTLGACSGGTETPVGEIVSVTDNLYEARTATHNTVFLVTPEGIILCDPISLAFSQWLKVELDARFDVPVVYVIYSHHHPDHTAGGIVFADTARFIAHETVVAERNAPLPSNAATLDSNGDGRLHRTEATALAYNRDFDHYNRDGDDFITSAEIHADTPAPDVVYADRMTIALGGSTVELIHPGKAHSDDMSIVLFPGQGALFGVDFMHVNRFPATLGGYPVARYAEAIARIQTLDYQIAIPGHGEIGDKADLDVFLNFLRVLETAVADGIADGRSVEDLQENLEFPDYEDWLLYDTRRRTLVAETFALLTGS
jgi:glyoxylase-like metal-dependent hydrolase (beta-lactamase superfamily II)